MLVMSLPVEEATGTAVALEVTLRVDVVSTDALDELDELDEMIELDEFETAVIE